jgi:hypothetical protein
MEKVKEDIPREREGKKWEIEKNVKRNMKKAERRKEGGEE